MRKCFFILAVVFSTAVFGQKINPEDYEVYTALLKLKIPDTAASVTVVKKLLNDTLDFFRLHNIVEAIKYYPLDSIQCDSIGFPGHAKTSTDSITNQYIANFYAIAFSGGTLTNSFHLTTKVNLIKKIPTARNRNDYLKHYTKRRDRFNKRHPEAGIIFLFSRVYFTGDSKTAIFIYRYRGRKFFGEEALTIMEKMEDCWKIKCWFDLSLQEL